MIDLILRRLLLLVVMVVFCGVVFHAPFSVWLGTVFPESDLFIKSWKELLTLFAVLLVAVQVSRRRLWRDLWNDWLIRLVALYGIIHLALLMFMWQGLLPAVAGLMIDLRFMAFFVVIYVSLRLYPQWRQLILLGGLAAAALSMLFVLLQLTILPDDILKYLGYGKDTIMPYLTVDQNYDYIRVNGTLRGPNSLGAYGVIVASICMAALIATKHKLSKLRSFGDVWGLGAVGLVSIVAIWFSYSRSAAIALLLAVAVIVLARYGRRISRSTWFAIGSVGLLIVGGLYVTKDTHFVSQVIMHEDPTEGNNINSNDGHWQSLVEGTGRMLRQPAGAGIGSTGSASLLGEQPFIIENYYLYVAHETGWLGLTLFIAVFGTVIWRLWLLRSDWLALAVLASGVGLAVANLFLPIWADDTVSIVWWGFAAVALTPNIDNKKEARRDS